MATNLRKRVEADLAKSLEGEWALPVILISPDAETIDKKKGTTDPLVGQVNYVTVETVPDTGEDIVALKPNVVLRLSSLERIPAEGEKWVVKIPPRPDPDIDPSEFVSYVASSDRGANVDKSIGFITMYLQAVEQS